jgi:DNA polymerase-1
LYRKAETAPFWFIGALRGAFLFCFGYVNNLWISRGGVGGEETKKFSTFVYMNQMGKAVNAAISKVPTLREAAKYLASLGYLVIQTGRDGDPKKPIRRAWNREAVANPDDIEAWGWPDGKAAGIAVVPDGRVVGIDIDAPKSGGKEEAAEAVYYDLLERFPILNEAWIERTPSGGYHIFIKAAPEIDLSKIKKSAKQASGVIIEAKFGRKAALTTHPTEIDGVGYQIINEPRAADELPELGLDFFVYLGLCGVREQNKLKRAAESQSESRKLLQYKLTEAFHLIETAERGCRNTNVFKAFLYIGKLKRLLGDRYENIKEELYNKAKERVVDYDFTEEELRRAALNGLTRGEAQPYREETILIDKNRVHPDFIAQEIAPYLEGRVVYIVGRGWLVWEGKSWKAVTKDVGIRGEIRDAVREIVKWYYRTAVDGEKSEKTLEALEKIEKLIADPMWVRKVEENLATDPIFCFRVEPKDLPKPEDVAHLLPVRNGVINLRSGTLETHEEHKNKYFLGCVDVEYNPNAAAPVFLDALRLWSAGDKEWVDYMQWMLGSLLTGDTSAQKMFIFYGKKANGKSTLLRIIAEILGDFATPVPSDLFKKKKSDTHPTLVMTLQGKRMAYCPDFPDKQALDEEIVKTQTGDKMIARRMREDYVSFDPTHKTIIATNDLPKVNSSREAVLRRLVPIPFRVTFEGSKKKDPRFIEKLRKEKEGILAWLVEGAKKYLSDPDRKPPKSIGDLWEKYKLKDDLVASFIFACIENKEGSHLSRKEVYEVFREYCELNGFAPLTEKVLTRRFREILKPEETKVNGERKYKNIAIKEDWKLHSDEEDLFSEVKADEIDKEDKGGDDEPDPSGGGGLPSDEVNSNGLLNESQPFTYEYIDNPSVLSQLRNLVKGAEIGFDLETTGLNPAHNKVRLLSIYIPSQNKTYVLDLFRIDRKEAWELLTEASLLIGHNINFDLAFIMQDGIYIDNPKAKLWDTMIAEHILEYNKTENKAVDRYSLEYTANKIGIRLNKKLQKSDWNSLLTEEQIEYAALDAFVVYEIYKHQKDRLDNGLKKAFAIEMGALPAVTMLRAFGVGVDTDKLNKIYEDLIKKTKEAENEVDEVYREELKRKGINDLSIFKGINWRSPKQIEEALSRIGLNIEDLGGTGKNILLKYKDNPVVSKLLAFRDIDKQRQLVGQWKKLLMSDGRIYANWKQIGADTGRMSCKEPNLQQVPSKLRECIVPKDGHVLIKADFSQIELRIAAVIANDARMLKAFDEGMDLHKLTAALVKNKNVDEVTKEERQLAKALNFGLIYGMREETLREYASNGYGVNITLQEAAEYRKRFLDTYSGIAKWHQKVEREIRNNKSVIVSTLGGRKREVSEVTAALNTPVQGSGADGLKAAAALYYKRLVEHGLIDKVRIVLMVHDEIVVEAPEKEALKAAHLLTEAMITGMQAIVKGVPIEVEVGIYADWGKTPHRIQTAWETFMKLPKESVVRDAILKGYEPDPYEAGDDLCKYYYINAILNNEEELPF